MTAFNNTLTLPTGGPSAASATADTTTDTPAVSRAFGSSVFHQVAPDVSSSGTVVGTLRTPTGGPSDPSAAKDTDRVVYRGAEMTVQSAVRMGILARDASGRLVDGSRPEQPVSVTPAHSQPSQPALEVEMPCNAREIQSALLETVPRTTLAAAMQGVLSNGVVSDGVLNTMASEAGIEPSQMREHLADLGDAMDRQAQTAFSKMGLDGEDTSKLEKYLEQNRPDVLRKASMMHLRGDLSGYREAAQLYFQNLDKIDPARILASDFGSDIRPFMSGKTVVLDIPGKGQVSYSAAVRAGVIKVG